MDVESVRNNHDAAASNQDFFFFLTIRLHSVESWVVFSLESCLESSPVCYLVTLLVFFFSFFASVFNPYFRFLLFFFWLLGFFIFCSVEIFEETVVFAECVYYACLSAILLLRSQ